MRRLLFGCGLLLAACGGDEADETPPLQTPPDFGAGPPPDAGADAAPPPVARNLGGDVPVVIDWIVPLEGRRAESPTPWLWVHDMAVDDDGATVLVGMRSGRRDIDPGPGERLLDAGAEAPGVTRFDASGALAWAFVWPQSFNSFKPLRVSIGPDGTIFVGGVFRADTPIDFDPGPGADPKHSGGVEHLFVARFTAAGEYLGTWTSSGDGTVELAGLAAGAGGDLWLWGYLTGFPDLDPTATTNVLRGGHGTPPPRVPWLVRWNADGAWGFGVVPDIRGVGAVRPLPDGGALVSGNYGGGDAAAWAAIDLDFGPGVDRPVTGCTPNVNTGLCELRAFWMRVGRDGLPAWSAGFADVHRSRAFAGPSAATGGALAAPDGSGLVLGTFRGRADFDWGPAQHVRETPDLGFDMTYDVFAAGFDPAGRFRGATPVRALRVIDGLPDARLNEGGWSGRDRTWHVAGYMTGALVFPAAEIGGVGRPLEGVVAAFDPDGHARWATGLGVGVELGGGGAPLLRTSARGATVMLGTFAGTADLDFTTGLAVHTASGPRDYYLLAFREAPCADGDARPCDCAWDAEAVVSATCADGVFGVCDCIDIAPNIDGSYPPEPAPDCGECAAGWTCDPATWLCATDAREVVADGLDHPLEVADDGRHVYAIVGGRYPRTTPPPESPARELWRFGDGEPVKLAEGMTLAHLAVEGGHVYWANGGLFRTASGGDGAVETVDAERTLTGPVVFDANAIYVAAGPNRVRRLPRAGGEPADWGTHAGLVRAMVADGANVWAITDGFGSLQYAGLYRLSASGWGGGNWERYALAADPRGLADVGDALLVGDAGAGGAIRRTLKATGATSDVLAPAWGDIGPFARDGDWVYFTRFGLPSAWTWTSEVRRVHVATGAIELVASSLVHAVDLDVRDGRVLVADHGETRRSTSLGAIVGFAAP